mgnify:CR=1 FL=1
MANQLSSKEEALEELEALIRDFDLAESQVSQEISGSKSFVARLRKPGSDMTTRTLDRVWDYILHRRGQQELDFDQEQEQDT